MNKMKMILLGFLLPQNKDNNKIKTIKVLTPLRMHTKNMKLWRIKRTRFYPIGKTGNFALSAYGLKRFDILKERKEEIKQKSDSSYIICGKIKNKLIYKGYSVKFVLISNNVALHVSIPFELFGLKLEDLYENPNARPIDLKEKPDFEKKIPIKEGDRICIETSYINEGTTEGCFQLVSDYYTKGKIISTKEIKTKDGTPYALEIEFEPTEIIP